MDERTLYRDKKLPHGWVNIGSCLLLLAGIALASGCGLLGRKDSHVFEYAETYFKAEDVQRTQQADPAKLPVQVNYTLHRKPVLRQAMQVDFEFVPRRASTYLGVGLRASEGLQWLSGRRQVSYSNVRRHEVIEQQLRVRPLEEGHFYIDVVVVMEVDGKKKAKSLQIPITLGINPQPDT